MVTRSSKQRNMPGQHSVNCSLDRGRKSTTALATMAVAHKARRATMSCEPSISHIVARARSRCIQLQIENACKGYELLAVLSRPSRTAEEDGNYGLSQQTAVRKDGGTAFGWNHSRCLVHVIFIEDNSIAAYTSMPRI